jgi:hypothetical protein
MVQQKSPGDLHREGWVVERPGGIRTCEQRGSQSAGPGLSAQSIHENCVDWGHPAEPVGRTPCQDRVPCQEQTRGSNLSKLS